MAKSRAHGASFDSTDTPRAVVSARSCPPRPQLSPTCVSRAPNAAHISLSPRRRSGLPLLRPPPPPRESEKSPSKLYPPPPKELRPDYLRGRSSSRAKPGRRHREHKSNGSDEGYGKNEAVIRRDYRLGDIARSLSHMIAEQSPKRAAAAVDAMTNLDFAFVRQSDGSWTYAVLALRSRGDEGPGPSSEESMLFVVDRTGRTTDVARSEWGRRVRPPAAESATPRVAAARRDEAPRRRRRRLRAGPGEVALERWRREFHFLMGARPPVTVSIGSQEEDEVSCLSSARELSGGCPGRGAGPVLHFC